MNESSVDGCVVAALEKLRRLSVEGAPLGAGAPSLIYPLKGGVKRVSEQEARMLFCAELLNRGIMFSVETPTVYKYRMTGEECSAGSIDVCVHDRADGGRRHVIEFKAHNTGGADGFTIDFEKLLREPGDNYFVHVLENADNGTLYRDAPPASGVPVINKYIERLKTTPTVLRDTYGDTPHYHSLTFYICVLGLCPPAALKAVVRPAAAPALSLDHHITKGVLTVSSANWEVIPLNP